MAPDMREFLLQLHYDEEADVLYASVNQPRCAVSFEVDTDILLRYIPPDPTTIGVTILGFLEHFPRTTEMPLLDHARAVVHRLLAQYPEVPKELVM
jgi:uncharacterized protein YuzE